MSERIDDIELALELIGRRFVDLDRRVREIEAEHAEALRTRDEWAEAIRRSRAIDVQEASNGDR